MHVKINTTLFIWLSIFLFLISFTTSIPPVYADSQPVIQIDHDVEITFGGVIIVKDTISIQNTGMSVLTHFQIGFPHNLTPNFRAIVARSAASDPLAIETLGLDPDSNIYWFNIQFPHNININEAYNFSVISAFSQIIFYNHTDNNNTVYFPEFPSVSSEVASCVSRLHLAEGTVFGNSSWGIATNTIQSPLPAKYNLTGWATFTGTQRLIDCPSSVRNIVLDSWGNSQYYDTYRIRNSGSVILSFFDFPLPTGAENVIAYDDFGSLSTSLSELDGSQVARVTFRYPLRGDDGTTQNNEVYTVTIRYRQATQKQLISPSPFTPLNLTIPVLPSPDFIIDKQRTIITLPEGSTFLQATPIPFDTSALLTPSIVYLSNNVSPAMIDQFSLLYEYNVFWATFRPTIWFGIFILGLVTIIYARRQKQPQQPPLPDKNVGLVQSLIEACTERMVLWNQIETLENDFDNRRIRRKDFNRRRRILIQRLSTINNEINSLSKTVAALDKQYQELIARLTEAETEIRNRRTEINRLRSQLRRGRLSSNAYKQQKEKLESEVKRAKATVDNIIFDLKNLVSRNQDRTRSL